jgi:hypothetical protein
MRVTICESIWYRHNKDGHYVMWFQPTFSLILAAALLYVTFVYLKQQSARERRIKTQRDLPREQLLPHHYTSFVEVENKLWAATAEGARTANWDTARIEFRSAELQLVRKYVRGLQEDFAIGNRIFAVVIGHSAEVKMLRQLEWQRIKIEFPYYVWHRLICFRLWMGQVSPGELRRLTEIVATLAYEVRSMLNVFERGGNVDFVEYLVRKS